MVGFHALIRLERQPIMIKACIACDSMRLVVSTSSPISTPLVGFTHACLRGEAES